MTETSFGIEEVAPQDSDREGLEPEVTVNVRYMQPGDEDQVLDLLDAATRRVRIMVGRALDANDKEK